MEYFNILIITLVTCCSVLMSYICGERNANIDNLVNNNVCQIRKVIPLSINLLMASDKQEMDKILILSSDVQVESFKQIITKCNKQYKEIMFEQLNKRKQYLEKTSLETTLGMRLYSNNNLMLELLSKEM